ncbi:MAG: ABC transporter ATP-binding protein, partial [Rhizobiaceae bacterium]|nr:ABC transporter ATP-binding protein [Rhizobiaceae bacterium]
MTEHRFPEPLLAIRNLTLRYRGAAGSTTILREVNLDLRRGEILGLIGESGAGKSTLGQAILGLLPPEFERTAGTICFHGQDLDRMSERQRDAIRGRKISAIFQDHTASLDPLMTIGAQVQETILATQAKMAKRDARARALELLARVGIHDPAERFRSFPHQLSGGQRQRVVIAIALAGAPDIIVADEPTSALDTTVQKQILRLLRELVDETRVSVILVTHDMGVISDVADRVLVMKNGEVVEEGATATLLDAPCEDYTRGLLAAVPRLRVSSWGLPDESAEDVVRRFWGQGGTEAVTKTS